MRDRVRWTVADHGVDAVPQCALRIQVRKPDANELGGKVRSSLHVDAVSDRHLPVDLSLCHEVVFFGLLSL